MRNGASETVGAHAPRGPPLRRHHRRGLRGVEQAHRFAGGHRLNRDARLGSRPSAIRSVGIRPLVRAGLVFASRRPTIPTGPLNSAAQFCWTLSRNFPITTASRITPAARKAGRRTAEGRHGGRRRRDAIRVWPKKRSYPGGLGPEAHPWICAIRFGSPILFDPFNNVNRTAFRFLASR